MHARCYLAFLLSLSLLNAQGLGEEATSNQDAIRADIVAALTQNRELVFRSSADSLRVLPNPPLQKVIAHGDEAIPLLIGALQSEGINYTQIRMIDVALIAIHSGEPIEQVLPLGSQRRLYWGRGVIRHWLEWYQNGCPVHVGVTGKTVPTGIYNYHPHLPDDWPPE